MSIIGNYRRITPEELADLLRDPDSIVDFLYPEDGSIDSDDRSLYVDKAWHGIHFLLTGQAWGGESPLRNAVLGGTPLGEVDVGYGPARFLAPGEVREVAEVLSRISSADLRARFEPSALTEAEIYPGIWDEGDMALEYLLEYYGELVAFFQEAGQSGDAVLVYTS